MVHIKSLSFITFMTIVLYSGPIFAEEGGGNGSGSSYFSLTPALVVNVNDEGQVRHLQVNIQFRLKDAADAKYLDEHKAPVQYALILLLGGQKVSDIRTVKGKNQLRKQALTVIQNVMTKNVGHPIIEAVYFTGFIIQ